MRARLPGAAVVVAMLVAFVLAGAFPPRRLEGSPELVRLLVKARQARVAERIVRPMAESHLEDVSAQYEYVMTHFAIPPARRDDETIRHFYKLRYETRTGHRRDVATYALGLSWLVVGRPRLATGWFEKVEDPHLPHLQSSWGEALGMLGDPAGARRRFWQEIVDGHEVADATVESRHRRSAPS